MIRTLALAWLLVLLPLPLSTLAGLSSYEAGEEGETGMAARPHFVVEAGVRVPAATSASVTSRLALPATVHSPPLPKEFTWQSVDASPVTAPLARLTLLGKLLLDGG